MKTENNGELQCEHYVMFDGMGKVQDVIPTLYELNKFLCNFSYTVLGGEFVFTDKRVSLYICVCPCMNMCLVFMFVYSMCMCKKSAYFI